MAAQSDRKEILRLHYLWWESNFDRSSNVDTPARQACDLPPWHSVRLRFGFPILPVSTCR